MKFWFRKSLCVATTIVLLSGCGYLRAESARQSALAQQLDAYVIPRPIDEVWPHVREPQGAHNTLLWSGITWTDTGPYTMRSSRDRDRRTNSSGGTTTDTTWYTCMAVSVPGGTRVHYTQIVESVDRTSTHTSTPSVREDRALDLELGLVKILDPQAGARIEAEGERAAQRAR